MHGVLEKLVRFIMLRGAGRDVKFSIFRDEIINKRDEKIVIADALVH